MLGYFGEDIKAAIGLMDRSLELNPSFAHGWRAVAVCCSRASRVSLISRAFSIAMRRRVIKTPTEEMGDANPG